MEKDNCEQATDERIRALGLSFVLERLRLVACMRSRQSQENGEQLGTGEARRNCSLLAGCRTVAAARPADPRTVRTACTMQLLCV
jgi:hypothetical protein